MARKKRDLKKQALAQAILDAYHPSSVEDMNDTLKDIFGSLFEAMLKDEMDYHLGYDSNDKCPQKNENRRNGFGTKKLKTIHGEVEIEVPRDREQGFGYVCQRNGTKRYIFHH